MRLPQGRFGEDIGDIVERDNIDFSRLIFLFHLTQVGRDVDLYHLFHNIYRL